MKLKARDIVPGWPKPKTFLVMPSSNFRWEWHASEFEELRRYREQQQRMITEHLELWRLNLKCFNCGHRYYAADADTAACPKCGNLAMMMWLRPIATA